MMNRRKGYRGFTLIELLVVISIIGLLATIVLASLKTAREKARNSRIQEELSSMRVAGELYLKQNGDYGTASDCTQGIFQDVASGMKDIVDNVSADIVDMRCGALPDRWKATAILLPGSTDSFWCVDSTGASKRWDAPPFPSNNNPDPCI
jgi:prepilin-type N-terminal cleavage/methylation domain-containing protein